MTGDSAVSSSAISKALNMLKRIRRLNGSALISGGVFLHEDLPIGTSTREFAECAVRMQEGFAPQGEEAKEILLGFEGDDVLFMFRYPAVLCLFFNRDEDLQSIESGGNQFLNQFGSLLGIQTGRLREHQKPIIDHEWTDEEFHSALTAPPADPAVPSPQLQAPVAETQEPAKQVLKQKIVPRTHLRTPPLKKQVTPPAPLKKTQPISLAGVPSDSDEFLARLEILLSKVINGHGAHRMVNAALETPLPSTFNKPDYLSFGQNLTREIKDRKVRQLIENELTSLIDSLPSQ